ncbi:putative glyoxalase/Bleomycin resistance protein/Dihydroxybiphenyl dioxygenase [Helianthus debilis subsp. tardiflorus]
MKEIAANPLLLKSLNHISLQCRSVEESVKFYTKNPWLFSYGIGIHLIQYEDAHNVPKKNEINTKDNHISFR